ncbi:MAG TPA: TonB-dependent receptor [Thermoanaerobaculia bacterium]|nr:TonB-dependent receptor [Thermoanaerobaculia bacterium]
MRRTASSWAGTVGALALLASSAIAAEQPEPPAVVESITVTATRGVEAAPGESGIVLSAEDLDTSAAPAVDVALRRVPGFTLFRRSDSRFAHPTSQGVSLRGTGASGAGRALVLADGIPANDPFGGWVQWGRVPRAAIERVEILRGGGSDVWGGAAMGGVVHLIRSSGERTRVKGELAAGSAGSADGSLYAALAGKVFSASVAIDAFTTDGYLAVPREARGPVDRELASSHLASELALRWREEDASAFVRLSRYDEERKNGTPLQVNDTEVETLSAGFSRGSADAPWSIRAWSTRQELRSTFSAVSEDRSSERLVRSQRVPADAGGAAGEWTRRIGRHRLVAGGDYRRASATSHEQVFTPAGSFPTDSGGAQDLAGAFVDVILAPRLDLAVTLALRGDVWAGESRTGGQSGGRRHAVSPRLSAAWEVGQGAWLVGRAYGAFRPPTLNELHRGFRVGEVVTLPNAELDAERLSGVEGGIDLSRGAGWLRARLFWMRIDDAIANVTLEVEPELITRMRENVGQTRSAGLELDARWSLEGGELSLGWLLTDARIVRFAGDPAIEGNRIPQVPRHHLTARALRLFGAIRIAGEIRWSTAPFDDDRNQIELDSSTVVDVHVQHRLGSRVSLFAAAENLLGERYEVARTPLPSLGPGRMIRLGVKIDVGPRVSETIPRNSGRINQEFTGLPATPPVLR